MAATATLAVFLYVKGVRDEAETAGRMVEVIVAKEDILAGQSLDELIAAGSFTTRTFPEDTLVSGVVTDLSELQGQKSAVPILAFEQISTARLEGSDELPGGALGIPKGHEAVTLALDIPRVIAGEMAAGDSVTVYATFDREETTVDLASNVQVLRVLSNAPEGTIGSETATAGTVTMVTLALTPREAQRVVFAQELGTVYLGLLPPGEQGSHAPPLSKSKVIR